MPALLLLELPLLIVLPPHAIVSSGNVIAIARSDDVRSRIM
jgi:hypothetical protein